MRPPPRYSVSPLQSIATRLGGRPPTFSEILTELLVGYGLVKRKPSLREQMAEQQRIEALAEELQDLDSPPALDSPEISPARPRRRKAK